MTNVIEHITNKLFDPNVNNFKNFLCNIDIPNINHGLLDKFKSVIDNDNDNIINWIVNCLSESECAHDHVICMIIFYKFIDELIKKNDNDEYDYMKNVDKNKLLLIIDCDKYSILTNLIASFLIKNNDVDNFITLVKSRYDKNEKKKYVTDYNKSFLNLISNIKNQDYNTFKINFKNTLSEYIVDHDNYISQNLQLNISIIYLLSIKLNLIDLQNSILIMSNGKHIQFDKDYISMNITNSCFKNVFLNNIDMSNNAEYIKLQSILKNNYVNNTKLNKICNNDKQLIYKLMFSRKNIESDNLFETFIKKIKLDYQTYFNTANNVKNNNNETFYDNMYHNIISVLDYVDFNNHLDVMCIPDKYENKSIVDYMINSNCPILTIAFFYYKPNTNKDDSYLKYKNILYNEITNSDIFEFIFNMYNYNLHYNMFINILTIFESLNINKNSKYNMSIKKFIISLLNSTDLELLTQKSVLFDKHFMAGICICYNIDMIDLIKDNLDNPNNPICNAVCELIQDQKLLSAEYINNLIDKVNYIYMIKQKENKFDNMVYIETITTEIYFMILYLGLKIKNKEFINLVFEYNSLLNIVIAFPSNMELDEISKIMIDKLLLNHYEIGRNLLPYSWVKYILTNYNIHTTENGKIKLNIAMFNPYYNQLVKETNTVTFNEDYDSIRLIYNDYKDLIHNNFMYSVFTNVKYQKYKFIDIANDILYKLILMILIYMICQINYDILFYILYIIIILMLFSKEYLIYKIKYLSRFKKYNNDRRNCYIYIILIIIMMICTYIFDEFRIISKILNIILSIYYIYNIYVNHIKQNNMFDIATLYITYATTLRCYYATRDYNNTTPIDNILIKILNNCLSHYPNLSGFNNLYIDHTGNIYVDGNKHAFYTNNTIIDKIFFNVKNYKNKDIKQF